MDNHSSNGLNPLTIRLQDDGDSIAPGVEAADVRLIGMGRYGQVYKVQIYRRIQFNF
jgi:hypothetical protein